jgi:hypothetical protein
MPRCYCHPLRIVQRTVARGIVRVFCGLEPRNRSTETSKTMLIEIRVDKRSLRRWQLALVERLSRNPQTRVIISWGNAIEPLPSCIGCLFALERLINGLPDTGGASEATEACFSSYAVAFGDPDLVLDLCGPAKQGSAPTWFVTFDGSFGDEAALGALLAGRSPVIDVVDGQSGLSIASARPGTERHGIILAAFEDCLARATTLIVAAVNGAASPMQHKLTAAAGVRCAAVARLAVASLVELARRRLYSLCCYAPHWRVGWRFVDGPDVIDLLAHPQQGWNKLRDDGLHFYADPFPIVVGDRTFLFVEDFDHRRGRGAISVVEFCDTGPLGAPRIVLDADAHLSYPFVFEHAGEMWMVPECVARRAIALYRASRFPDAWQFEAILVADVEASDPTLFHDAGRWWMMATVRDNGGSFSDALYLWSAASLFGPWMPHRKNPVLIDIAAARPAGRVVHRGNRRIRPVQDCQDGYGSALALAEITRLDDDEFDQTILATLRSGDLWPGRRLHTLNRAGRLECIDGSAIAIKAQSRMRQRRSRVPAHAGRANASKAITSAADSESSQF